MISLRNSATVSAWSLGVRVDVDIGIPFCAAQKLIRRHRQPHLTDAYFCPKGRLGGGFIDERIGPWPSCPLHQTSAEKGPDFRAKPLGLRRRQRQEGRGGSLGHLPQREVGRTGPDQVEKLALSQRFTPADKRRPAIRRRRPDHPPRIED